MPALLGSSIPTTLIDDEGRALKSLTVAVTGPGGYTGTATTDPVTGAVELTGLPIGDYFASYGGRTVKIPVVPSAADLQAAVDRANAALLAADAISTYVAGLVTSYGAVGGNAAVDTAAFQAALAANDGVVFVPEPPSGLDYEINATLVLENSTKSKGIVGLGNGLVKINYSGTGYFISAISATPSDPAAAVTDLYFSGLKIDGNANTVSDGGFYFDGAYSMNFDRVEVRRFAKAGAYGVRLLNCFSIDWSRSNVLSITNGIGMEVGGSLQQNTNTHLHDFLIQRCGTAGLDITTGITGGGLMLDNGAIRANDSGIAVRCTGKFSNMRFGPALHVESETVTVSNTTTGFKFSGASLFASVVRFEGIDFYNLKTLLDLDGSAGTLRNVTIDDVYATALAGLAGTGFKLNTVTPHLRVGRVNVNSSQYTTLYSLTNTEIAESIWVDAAQFVSVLGAPALGNQLRWPVWLLDAATSEIVAATVRLPRDWNTFAIDAHWTNVAAGAGDVVLRVDQTTRGAGETLATPAAGTPVTATSGATNVVNVTTVLGSGTNTAAEVLLLDMIRAGGDAADTLPNDIGLLGVLLRRVG